MRITKETKGIILVFNNNIALLKVINQMVASNMKFVYNTNSEVICYTNTNNERKVFENILEEVNNQFTVLKTI